MKRPGFFRVSAVAVVLAAALACAACSSSATTPAPSGPHLFAAEYLANQVAVLGVPLSASSTPAFSVSGFNNDSGVAFDSMHNLYVSNTSTPSIAVFAPPYSAASTPSFAIAGVTSGLVTPEQIGFDPSGNLWVADEKPQVVEYKPPFSASSAPSQTVTMSLSSPQGVAFDASANMYVADNNTTLFVFAPPYSGAPLTTIHGLQFPLAVTLDATHVYVADFGTKGIVAFNLPIAGGDMPAYTITNGMTNGPHGLVFDSSGNLLVGTNAGEIVVFAPPLSAASTPLFTIPCFDAPNCLTRQLAFGP